jgi:FlaA1/EpsC-like NDP-sugar epimerase
MNILELIGRDNLLFTDDLLTHDSLLTDMVGESRFLVLGGAGSIGQAVTKEIFKRNPKKLHVVDISENNLVELVRDIRSSYGYISGDFKTFALDIGSVIYDAFIESDGHYDYVLNLSALKHVRSEKDEYTLMRMIETNILNTTKTVEQSIHSGVKKYFCVSTDKAANPVNLMGASKRVMELFLNRYAGQIDISTARFANVAFSDGSLLHGFNKRIEKQQPIVAPSDIKRYFVVPQEAGELCLFSALLGESNDIFFPKLSDKLHLITFSQIAEHYLTAKGLEPYYCETEDEARNFFKQNNSPTMWPVLFTASDTTGEKDFEEFFTHQETLDIERFVNLGIVKGLGSESTEKLRAFETAIQTMLRKARWSKAEIVSLFNELLPDFGHLETGKYLDAKM